jgi:hypothetical protein
MLGAIRAGAPNGAAVANGLHSPGEECPADVDADTEVHALPEEAEATPVEVEFPTAVGDVDEPGDLLPARSPRWRRPRAIEHSLASLRRLTSRLSRQTDAEHGETV